MNARTPKTCKPTCTLSVSARAGMDCDNLAVFLQHQGITCSVSSTTSVIRVPGPRGLMRTLTEKGCRIVTDDVSPAELKTRVWQPVAARYDLKCAHVKCESHFSGCIHDLDGDSNCPGAN